MLTPSRTFSRNAVVALVTLGAATPAIAAFDHQHSAWAQVLKTHVRNGAVSYGKLAQNRASLDRYTEALSALNPTEFKSYTRKQRMAIWINAYNALTVKLILDQKPSKSIRDIGDPWKGHTFQVAARQVTLDQIEHAILRKDYFDARLHFVLVCAAQSCPILDSRPFLAPTLSAQMERAARRFARDTRRNTYDASANTLRISKIFEWFADDFKRHYAKDQDAAQGIRVFFDAQLPAAVPNDAKIEYTNYDWSLNGVW